MSFADLHQSFHGIIKANVFCALVKSKSGSAGISTARCFMAAGGVTGDFSQMRRLLQSTMKSLSPRPATQAVTLPDWAVSGTDELKHLNSCYSKLNHRSYLFARFHRNPCHYWHFKRILFFISSLRMWRAWKLNTHRLGRQLTERDTFLAVPCVQQPCPFNIKTD